MICSNCGNEIPENAQYCIHCGKDYRKKTLMGFLLGYFLGIIGLIIGLCMFESGTRARNTFLKGWCIAFVVSFVIGFVSGVLYYLGLYPYWLA